MNNKYYTTSNNYNYTNYKHNFLKSLSHLRERYNISAPYNYYCNNIVNDFHTIGITNADWTKIIIIVVLQLIIHLNL